MTMIRHYLVFVLCIAVFLVIAAHYGINPTVEASGTTDQIKFSHKFHQDSVGIACTDCHGAATESNLASDNLKAGHDQCGTCHEQQISDNCAMCHSDPDNISPSVSPDREVVFAHKAHLKMEGVECGTCHVGVENAVDLASVDIPAMETCTTCHESRKATNTCETCHTNFVALIPSEHLQSDFLRNHRDDIRLGSLNASCQTCHEETFCQECHQGAGLVQFGAKGLMADPVARNKINESSKLQKLQKVHELNYSFSHGIDARTRQQECSACHSESQFCMPCHVEGGLNQSSFKPQSHFMPGFTTIGKGSGGGVHAEEAHRDIESCMACHDVEGKDPSCLVCHTPEGGVY